MSPVALADRLSDHDKMVLEAIFTPTQVGSDFSSTYNEELPEELKGELNNLMTYARTYA